MILGASVFYLLACFVLLGIAYFRTPVSRDGAVAILLWYALVNAIYQRDIVEWRETIFVSALFIAFCGVLIWKHGARWLLIFLSFMGVAMAAWAWAFRSAPAYDFKLGRNVIAITAGYLPVMASLVPWGTLWTKIRKK